MHTLSEEEMKEIAEEIKAELKEKTVDELLEKANSSRIKDEAKEKRRIYKKRWMAGKQYLGE